MLRGNEKKGSIEYYVSDDVEKFSYLGSMFLGYTIGSEVIKIDIEKY